MRPPGQVGNALTFEDPDQLGELQKLLPAGLSGFSYAFLEATLQWLGRLHRYSPKRSEAEIPEATADTLEFLLKLGLCGSCNNDTNHFLALVQSLGFKARAVEFLGADGLGGQGHTLSEVWLPERENG